MTKYKVAYLYSEQPDYVRVKKVLKIFADVDADVHYIGCRRGNDNQRNYEDLDDISLHIANINIPHGGFGSLIKTTLFLCYAIYVVIKIKPDLIVGVNEELCFPFAKLFKRPRLICELYDSLALRASSADSWVGRICRFISESTLSNCDALIEVSYDRLQLHTNRPANSIVIPNSIDKNVNANFVMGPLAKRLEKITTPYIYVSGSFTDEINGLEQLLSALDVIDTDCIVVAAGRPNGAWVNSDFVNHARVTFIGHVSPNQSQFIAKNSIGLFAYYKPISLLYEHAAPNKIFDAMSLGIPIFMNSECKATQFSVNDGFGLAARYSDVNQLANNIKKVIDSEFYIDKDVVIDEFHTSYEWKVVSEKYRALVSGFVDSKERRY